jgi:hypothetical protein
MQRILTLVILFFLISTVSAGAEKYYPDDPIQTDNDMRPVTSPVKRKISQIVDFFENTFSLPETDDVPRALNINTLDKVPNSSWFTNRHGQTLMTVEELVRGPNTTSGPDTSGPWSVVGAKSEGISPGFTIRDATGELYFIKFDPVTNPEMATGAELICTKLFYAFGYNVPENYLSVLDPGNLIIAGGATLKGEEGSERPIKPEDIGEILEKVVLQEDGTARIVASKALPGRPLGPFNYRRTRRDDPNDIFSHEDRRELRALRLFSAWTNHDDSRSVNTLDMFIKVSGEEGYVRHNLIDFGSTLGSGSVTIQRRRAGNEYILEWPPTKRAAVSLGWWDRPWRKFEYPDYPSIGRFESEFFDAELWKPEYPNPAFVRMRPDDAFWAARIINRFSDEHIRAIVGTAEYSDPEAEAYMAKTLIERRDKIVEAYLTQVNPLVDFRVSEGKLHFKIERIGEESELFAGRVEYSWYPFDNESERCLMSFASGHSRGSSLDIPPEVIQADSTGAQYFVVDIHAPVLEEGEETRVVSVYLRCKPDRIEVVGKEREIQYPTR